MDSRSEENLNLNEPERSGSGRGWVRELKGAFDSAVRRRGSGGERGSRVSGEDDEESEAVGRGEGDGGRGNGNEAEQEKGKERRDGSLEVGGSKGQGDGEEGREKQKRRLWLA